MRPKRLWPSYRLTVRNRAVVFQDSFSTVGAERLLSAVGVVGRSWRTTPLRFLRLVGAQQARGNGYPTHDDRL